MAAELPEPSSKVWVSRDDTSDKGPRYWVQIQRPGSDKLEEYSYRQLMGTPSNIEEDIAIKRDVQRQHRALEKEWKEMATEKPPAPHTFEIVNVLSDRSPYSPGFDMSKHLTIYYMLDGKERTDTPASLNKVILANPERYPPDAKTLIGRAVNQRVSALEFQCKPPEKAGSVPEAEGVLDVPPVLEDAVTATPEVSVPIKEEPASIPEPMTDIQPSCPTQVSAECEVRPVPMAISEAESIYRFRKLSMEQGEEAAVTAKREEEAPRVEAQEQRHLTQMLTDEELLRNGDWLNIVLDALNEDIAGEGDMKKLCILSATASALKKRIDQATLHLFTPGDSQVGKSWIYRHAGKTLLPATDFLQFTTISAKGLNYLADEMQDPRYFEGKVLFVDELAQQSPEARAMIKVLMSIGQDEVSNLTVDDKKKSKRQSFTVMPTVWSCAAEAFEDAEKQLLNRPIIAAVDESANQTEKIHTMQKGKSALGTFYAPESKKGGARRLIARIREARDAEVLVLFSDYYRPDNDKARGEIPQFDALVTANAYCNRFARPCVTDSDGHMIIFATFEDGIEATRIWGKFIKHKTTHLAQRFIDVLDGLAEVPKDGGRQATLTDEQLEEIGKTADQLTADLNTDLGKGWSLRYVKNMLGTLSNKGLAEYHECSDGKNRWVALMHPSQASQFITYVNVMDGGEMLAKRILELKERASHRHKEIIEKLPEDLFEQILLSSMIPLRSSEDSKVGAKAPALGRKH